MTIDRSTRIVLTVIAVALVVIALNPWLPAGRWTTAVTPALAAAESGPQDEVSVPRAWGKVRVHPRQGPRVPELRPRTVPVAGPR